ncbi:MULTISPECIES: hypothetical protein [unclassified Bradyrhizobium]|uniref:hypothetical protein n=1 Tax=unclassified Bradyrhizobium TaxID=2631580 RepID=UPI0029167D90|nr:MULTISPECIES: hypothetical protein [unclassified Bradyrhizobium]
MSTRPETNYFHHDNFHAGLSGVGYQSVSWPHSRHKNDSRITRLWFVEFQHRVEMSRAALSQSETLVASYQDRRTARASSSLRTTPQTEPKTRQTVVFRSGTRRVRTAAARRDFSPCGQRAPHDAAVAVDACGQVVSSLCWKGFSHAPASRAARGDELTWLQTEGRAAMDDFGLMLAFTGVSVLLVVLVCAWPMTTDDTGAGELFAAAGDVATVDPDHQAELLGQCEVATRCGTEQGLGYSATELARFNQWRRA